MSQVIGQLWREVVGCRNWPVMRVPLFIALRRNDVSESESESPRIWPSFHAQKQNTVGKTITSFVIGGLIFSQLSAISPWDHLTFVISWALKLVDILGNLWWMVLIWWGNTVLQGFYPLSSETSYRQISWSLKAMRLDVIMIVSLWNLTGILAVVLPRYLLNFRMIGKV